MKELRIPEDISIFWVHRLRKRDEFREQPRNIIAKFTYYKDREYIYNNAPRRLKGSRYFVNEHYPPEIEAKRKKLYPVMRKARQDHKKVKLVRDSLYIDGKLYTPLEDDEARDRRDQKRETTKQGAQMMEVSSQARREPRTYSSAVSSNNDRDRDRERQSNKRQRQRSTPERLSDHS